MNSAEWAFTPLTVPPGSEGVRLTHEHLKRALDGAGLLAPIPQANRHFPQIVVDRIAAALNPSYPPLPDTVAILTTSGSTGNPRAVEFNASSLTALNGYINSGQVIDQHFDSPLQWIVALPVTSVGGFNVLTRAIDSGLTPLALESVAGAAAFSVDEVVSAVQQSGDSPAAISLVPTQLRRLLGSEAGTDALKRCALVIVGGSSTPVSDQIRCRDEGIFAVFSYGMTETTGGCIFSGRPAPGVHVEVHPVSHVISISGETIASGYRPAQGHDQFEVFEDRFTTNDFGDTGSDGSLHVLGRIDDIVIVNGVNISLNAIKEIIDSHPAINDSYVLPNLTALIVTDASTTSYEDTLRAEIGQHLGTLAVPSFQQVSHLPHLPNGKHDRQQILTLYG